MSPDDLMRHYRTLVARRAKQASREKAQPGELPGCAPVSYHNARDQGEPALEVDGALAPLVRSVRAGW